MTCVPNGFLKASLEFFNKKSDMEHLTSIIAATDKKKKTWTISITELSESFIPSSLSTISLQWKILPHYIINIQKIIYLRWFEVKAKFILQLINKSSNCVLQKYRIDMIKMYNLWSCPLLSYANDFTHPQKNKQQ